MRRRYAFRSSSNSKNTWVTLSEISELSVSVDAYFDRQTPFQLDHVVEEQVHRAVPRPRHPIGGFMRHSLYIFSLSRICIYDIKYIRQIKCRKKSILIEPEEQRLGDVTRKTSKNPDYFKCKRFEYFQQNMPKNKD